MEDVDNRNKQGHKSQIWFIVEASKMVIPHIMQVDLQTTGKGKQESANLQSQIGAKDYPHINGYKLKRKLSY